MSQIINIRLESDLSEFTSTVTDSGDLSWSNDATAQAVAGTAGALKCVIDDTTAIYGEYNLGTSITSGTLRLRVYLDVNSLTMADNNLFSVVRPLNSTPVNIANLYLLRTTTPGYQLSVAATNDAAADEQASLVSITDAPHYVEILLQRATNATSNDGSISWWIDGNSQTGVSNIDNYDRFNNFDAIRIGAVTGIDAGTSGTFYLDELVVNDDGSEIGPLGTTYNDTFLLIRNLNVNLSESEIFETVLSLAKNLSISLDKTSAYAVDDVILEWTTQVLNVYNEAFSLSKIDAVSLSSVLIAESNLSLNRRLAISLLTNIVQSVTIDLAKSLNIYLLAGANYSDTLSLSKQLAISLSEIKSIEMAFALGKQLSISTLANAVYLASISLAKTLDLSLVSSATYETAISLIRDLALILDATVTGSAQTYEEAFALSKTLSVTKSTLLDAIEAITLARSLAFSVSASMISSENFALGKQINISLLSGLLLDSALSLIRDEAFTTNKTLTLNENIGLVEYRAISDSALAEMAAQLSLGKSVSISVSATLVLEEDITLGKILAIQISGGKVYDDAFVLSILQAIAIASSVILFVGQIPAKLVINDQTVWLVSAHDNLVSDDIIETDNSQSDIIIKDVDHV